MFWRIVLRVCFCILWLAAVTVGLAAYFACYFPDTREYVIQRLATNAAHGPGTVLNTAGVVLLLVALLALWAAIRLETAPPLLYDTAEGQVVIAAASLRRFVEETVRACSGVKHVCVTTHADKRKVNVEAQVTVSDETPVNTLVAGLQHHVRRRVQDVFGFDLLRDIRIEVAGVVPQQRHTHHLIGWKTTAGMKQRDERSSTQKGMPTFV